METHLCVALCSVLWLPACIDLYENPELEPLEGEAGLWRDAEVVDFWFDGRVATIRAGENQYAAETRVGRSYLFVDLRADGNGNAVMNQLSVSGIGSMEYGRTYRSTEPSSEVSTSIVACSGPRDGEWNREVYVPQVEVRLEEGQEEGTVELFFNAYSPGSLSTRGHIVIQH